MTTNVVTLPSLTHVETLKINNRTLKEACAQKHNELIALKQHLKTLHLEHKVKEQTLEQQRLQILELKLALQRSERLLDNQRAQNKLDVKTIEQQQQSLKNFAQSIIHLRRQRDECKGQVHTLKDEIETIRMEQAMNTLVTNLVMSTRQRLERWMAPFKKRKLRP